MRDEPAPPSESFEGPEAYHHLCEVAAGLDSLVVGEQQILRQLRTAFASARAQGLAGPRLTGLGSKVFRAARAVRSKNDLFRGAVSLVPLTEELVRGRLLGVDRPETGILGTGPIARQMALLVRRTNSTARVHVVSRHKERARAFAQTIDAQAHDLDAFSRDPPRLDVLACAMRASGPLVEERTLRALVHPRGTLVLDLAMPRTTPPDASPIENLTLVQMDDLAEAARVARAARSQEIVEARGILATQAQREARERQERVASGQIARLGVAFARVRRDRLASMPGALGSEDAQRWLDLTIKALFHEAVEGIKEANRRP
jgi:glutamyl-tRNA reductase